MNWGAVRAGLTQTMVGQFFLTVFLAAMLLMSLEENRALGRSSSTALTVLTSVMGVMGAAGGILMVAGMCFARAVPEESGAREVTVGIPIGVGLMLVFLLLTLIAEAENRRVVLANMDRSLSMSFDASRQPPVEPPFGKAAFVTFRYGMVFGGVLQALCWVICLMKIARYLRTPDLSGHATCYLIFSLVLWFVAFLLMILNDMGKPTLKSIDPRTITYGALGVSLVMAFWGALLSVHARGAIGRSAE
jgi:hypothetical protein